MGGAPHGTLVTADEQSDRAAGVRDAAGRPRPGARCCSSVVLRSSTPCCRCAPGSPWPTSPGRRRVKWPNDVLLDGRKVGRASSPRRARPTAGRCSGSASTPRSRSRASRRSCATPPGRSVGRPRRSSRRWWNCSPRSRRGCSSRRPPRWPRCARAMRCSAARCGGAVGRDRRGCRRRRAAAGPRRRRRVIALDAGEVHLESIPRPT